MAGSRLLTTERPPPAGFGLDRPSLDRPDAGAGLRHVVLFRQDDGPARAAVERFQRLLVPGAALAAASERVAVLAGGAGSALHLPPWAGVARQEAPAALARLAGHRPAPARFALWHVVASAESAGAARAAAAFFGWAASYSDDAIERISLFWAIVRRDPAAAARELGEATPLLILPHRLGASSLTPEQHAEMAGQALADAVAGDLGGMDGPFLRDLCQPERRLLLGVRAAYTGADLRDGYVRRRVAAAGLRAALLADQVTAALPAIDDILAAHGEAAARRAAAVAEGWKESFAASFQPGLLLSLRPDERAVLLADAHHRLTQPTIGHLARAVRALQDELGTDEALGIAEVRAGLTAAIGAGPGGAIAVLGTVRDAVARADLAMEESDRPAPAPTLRLEEEIAAIQRAGPRVDPPLLVWAIWGAAVAAALLALVGLVRLGGLLPAAALAPAAVTAATALVMVVGWRRAVRAVRQAERALYGRPLERIGAFCAVFGGCLGGTWLPARRRARLAAIGGEIADRIAEWRDLTARLDREAADLRTEIAGGWTLHLDDPAGWDDLAAAIAGRRAPAAVLGDLAGAEDAGAAGEALLGRTPAEMEAAALAWADAAGADRLPPLHWGPWLGEPATIVGALARSAAPDGPCPIVAVLGGQEPAPPPLGPTGAVRLPDGRGDWLSVWVVQPLGEEAHDAGA